MRAVLVCLAALVAVAPARAELTPDQVALLTTASPLSRELAEYYAKARGIPRSQVYALDVKPGEDLSRSEWDQRVRPALREWLAKGQLGAKVRCLVTVWDVPLRIGGRPKDAPVAVARRQWLTQARQLRLGQFASLVRAVHALAAKEKPAEYAPPEKAEARQLAADFEAALAAARKRVEAIPPGDEQQRAQRQLDPLFVAGAGGHGLINVASRHPDPAKIPADLKLRLELLKARTAGLDQGVEALANLPESVARDEQMLRLVEQVGGLLGVLRWIDEEIRLLDRNETQASFDSELSAVLWPEYPLARWQANPLHYRFDQVPVKRATLMVSRLAAPKPELVKRMIDAAVSVEKTGLAGKVYLDARGLAHDPKPSRRGGYSEYDQSIRDLAERLRKHTKLDVTLDNEAKLFEPKKCPDAALYCGWYSLANYVDAFTWRPGAVGYHIASSEAVDLRSPGSKLWCPAMLERGAAATLGPTFEPYLAAFPPPDDFFPLLLAGKHTLAETYYRTAPFVSWAMVLLGDPLYNPFKARPAIAESALPERMKPGAPAAPEGSR